MKKIILLILFISSYSLFSQNHYMIPDIGAPDMAVYVELVAPHDEKGYFGDDGFYLPGVNDEVDFNVTKNDALVEFGPTVVSWEGRLISTHIFVKQTAAPTQITPDPAWQVEFSVEGTTVPAPRDFTFSIVQPQTLGNNGDITGINETIFGEGNLGVRSARGAMIVDSLVLKDNTTYTVTTNDPDNDLSNGNQGYFPAIILSKGPIKGNNSVISVSSTNKHAGPGGGGGGGNYNDVLFSKSGGTDGGDGFTPGGKGGVNGDGDEYRNFGNGTGPNGFSFNGIPVDNPMFAYEASYGGTGHPFGTVGKQSRSGSDADEQGGYGGGSGYRNNTQGGAGGYANAGGGDAVTGGTTGGKVHGNEMTIPLAGGSGGASGNPSGFPVGNSGDGGGGGGALLLFGREIDGVSIHADGDDGRNGNRNAEGGPGSGGAAVILSKNGIANSTLSVQGGSRSGRNGGAGRVRFDGHEAFTPLSSVPDDASSYRGISTDSSNVVTPKHRLIGTHEPGQEVLIYIKSDISDWQLLRPSFSPGSVSWGVNFDFDEFHQDEYYISVVQTETQSVVDDYTYVPEYVLSQAATNIIRFGEPDIYCPKDTSFNLVNCSGATITDSIQIQSIGGDYLYVDPWKLAFGDRGIDFTPFTRGVRVVPDGPDSLIYVKFSYNKLPGQSGIITDTLYLFHDGVSNDTCAIAININLQDVDVTFLNEQETQVIDTLDLGVICKGELATAKFNIRNDSEFDISNLGLTIVDDGNEIASSFDVVPNNVALIAKDQSIIFDVNFQDLSNTAYPNGVYAWLVVSSDECPDGIDTLVLKATVAEAELAFDVAGDLLDFGNVNPNQTKDMVVVVTNVGDKPALIPTPPMAIAPFAFKSAAQPLPYLLQPLSVDPSAKLELTYTFAPTMDGNYNYTTTISSIFSDTEGSCETDKELKLTGKSSLANIEFPDTLDFGILYECETDSMDVFIKNKYADLINLKNDYRIIDENPVGYFSIANVPNSINSGGSNSFRIGFVPPTNPSISGIKTAKLAFGFEEAGDEVFEIILKAEVDTFDIMITPGSIFDLGDVPIGLDVAPKQFTLNNRGKLPRTITGFTQEPNSKLTITKFGAGGFPVVIQPGGTQDFDVDIDLDVLGPFSEDVVAEFLECDNQIEMEIIANGVEAELAIPTDLDLGVRSPCLDETIRVEFRNEGDTALLLDSLEVESNGKILYSTNVNQLINEYNGTNAHFEDIVISESVLPFGDYSATLIAYYTANGQIQSLPKQITAQIKSGIVITPEPVDYGRVFIGSTNDKLVNIAIDNTAPFANGQDINVNVNNTNLLPNFNEYNFNSPNLLTLNSGNIDDDFNINFSPNNFGNFDAVLNLEVSLENGCTYFVPVNLLADATEGDTLYVYAKDMLEVDPNLENFSIPIYGRISNIANEDGKNVDVRITNMVIRFNKTVFFPMSVSNGSIKTMMTDPTLASVELDMQSSVNVTEDEVLLTELIGSTLLGNEKDNLVIIESSIETQDSIGISQIRGNNSFFNLTICQEGGDRLLEYKDGLDYDLQQINGKIIIDATLIESGKHKFSLMDMTGSKQTITEFVRTSNDDSNYNIEYDISNLTSGVYYILMESPARFKTEKIVIVK